MVVQEYLTTQSMSFKGTAVVGCPQLVHIGDCFHDRALPERTEALFEVFVDGQIIDV